MNWLQQLLGRGARANIENPTVPVSAKKFLEFFGLGSQHSAVGMPVTIGAALQVPAIWAAVNFLSGTLAGLPLHLYRRKGENRERATGPLAVLLHDAVNDEVSSFGWRKAMMDAVLTGGRHCTFIERNVSGRIINFWPLDPTQTTVRRANGRKTYDYNDGGIRRVYEASEIIDIPFMLADDQLKHRSPLLHNADTVGLAIAATQYGARFFRGGGVPPFAISGNFQSPGAMQRAADDLQAAVLKASKEERQALVLPLGLDIKEIGTSPDKMQFVELKRFLVEEVARIYSLPPNFVQDLSKGTFSNTEQQDLHLVKHTLRRWVTQIEQELNLKLFGRASTVQFVEFNLDGILRGDFKTRMDGYAQGIQNAVLKPNEARRRENLPDVPDGDRLLIQGATVPLGSQPAATPVPTVPQPPTTGVASDAEGV